MDKHTEQHLDNLAKKVIKDVSIETPTSDFTANVMAQIKSVSIESSIAYKPLISKYIWFAIIGVLVALSFYVMTTSGNNESWLSTLEFDLFKNINISESLSEISISKSVVYAIGFLGLMLLIQIPMLKNYHNKLFEL